MRKRLLLSLVAAVCCMGMWAQTTGPADNEIWYTSTDGNPVAFDFESIGTPVTNVKPDGKDYFVATFASKVTSLSHGYANTQVGNYPTLKTITVPACLESIGDLESEEDFATPLFGYMKNFESITFPEDSKLNCIAPRCFEQSGIKSICIPKGVTTIPANAFNSCGSLNTVTFASGSQLKTIGVRAFFGARLKSIVIPASVTTIEYGAFEYGNSGITFASGSQLETIGGNAFNGAIIESITIPASVKTIGEGAFYEASIGTIIFEGTPETIDDYAFEEIWEYDYCYEDPDFDPIYSFYSFLLWGEEKTSEELTDDEKNDLKEAALADGWEYWPYEPYYRTPANFFKWGTTPTLILPADWSGEAYVDDETPWYGGCFVLVEKTQEVTEAGWTSMYLDYNYTLPVGTVAFYASKAEGSQITLQPISGVIPANTGVVIKAPKESTLCITKTTEGPTTTITGNLFRGVTEDTTNPGDVYVLSPATTESNPVFQNYTGAKLGANKAYILKSDLSGAESNTLRFVIGNKATGIEAVSADDTAITTTVTYNLQGQRVSDDYRGIVIKNGRKMWNN